MLLISIKILSPGTMCRGFLITVYGKD